MEKIYCGGFYVDDGAMEIRDGKKYLKTGGSDPIVENAKETGGFGWTEEVYTKIFDDVVESMYASALHICTIDIEADGIVDTIGTKYRLTVDGESCELITVEGEGGFVMLEKISGTLNPQFDALQISEGDIFWFVYTTEVSTYNIQLEIAESAVHTIDPKYLGGGGGEAVYFDVSFDGEDYALTDNKTVQDIADAFELKPKVYIRCADIGNEFIALVTEKPVNDVTKFIAVAGTRLFGTRNLTATYLQLYTLTYQG